jgi:acetyl esterase
MIVSHQQSRLPLRDRLAASIFRAHDARSKRRGTRVDPLETAAKPVAERLGGVPPWFVTRPGPSNLTVTHHQLESGASVRCYEPPGPPSQPRPCLLFLHGGGWIWGSTDTFDPFLRRAAAALGSVVVGVDYRLAPEHRFPSAVSDCTAALSWLRSMADPLQVATDRIAVMGESAGANLAAALTLHERDAGADPPLVAQVLVYPATDLTLSDAWLQQYRGPGLTTQDVRTLAGLYLARDADAHSPLASPQRADSLAGLPPALVITAGLDPLWDQGRTYAARLGAEGVPCRWLDFPRMPHGFFGGDRMVISARLAQEAALQELAARLGTVRSPQS